MKTPRRIEIPSFPGGKRLAVTTSFDDGLTLAVRQRVVIAANRASAFNPSGMPVTLKLDDRLFDVPAGQTVSLAD